MSSRKKRRWKVEPGEVTFYRVMLGGIDQRPVVVKCSGRVRTCRRGTGEKEVEVAGGVTGVFYAVWRPLGGQTGLGSCHATLKEARCAIGHADYRRYALRLRALGIDPTTAQADLRIDRHEDQR